jgi:hypothetical protein
MFDRSVLVADQRRQAFDLHGLRLVPRIQVVQRVLVVHHDLATRLALAAGIVTRLARVCVSRRDNNPAMQLARVAGIVTRLVRARISRRDNNRRRRGLGRPRRGVAERSPPRDKVTTASAIALRGEGDLASSKNAQCETVTSGDGCSHREVAHARLHYFHHRRGVRGHWSRTIPDWLTSQK